MVDLFYLWNFQAEFKRLTKYEVRDGYVIVWESFGRQRGGAGIPLFGMALKTYQHLEGFADDKVAGRIDQVLEICICIEDDSFVAHHTQRV